MSGKKKFVFPNVIVLIFAIILIACAMTWFVPGGRYERVTNSAGVKVVDPTRFSWIEATPINPFNIMRFVLAGFKNNFSLFIAILCGGALMHFVIRSRALESLVSSAAKKLKGYSWIFIPVITFTFTLLCTNKSLSSYLSFAPVLVIIAHSLGFDSIVGVAMLILGGGVGLGTGTLQTSTTMVAQGLAELPLFSGLWYRTICLLAYSAVSITYLVNYCFKIKRDPTKSYMYDLDNANVAVAEKAKADDGDLESYGRMDASKIVVLILLVSTLAILIYGALNLKWNLDEFSIGYIWSSIAMGLAMKMNPSKIAVEFFNGAKEMLFVSSMVCVASAISLILAAGGIIDTIVYSLAKLLLLVPHMLIAPALFIINILINVLISSGSGQAAVVIPIMTPLADILGVTRQTAVLAYNFGDGFSNYVLPTVGSLMGILGLGRVPYDRWMKFMGKLFCLWVLLGCVLLFIAQMIHLGPM